VTTVAYDHGVFSLQQVGGISRYFCELAPRVEQEPGWRSTIVAPLHFNEHLARSGTRRIGLHLRMLVPRTTRLYRAANAVLTPALLAALNPDIVHRTYYTAAPRPRRGRLVITVFDMIHELFAPHFPADDPVREHKRRCVEAADHVICISHSTADDLMRLLDVPADKISVTHLGFSDAFAAAHDSDVAPIATAPYLLYVGQRNGYKNFESVLRAYASSARLAADFDLLAFGGGAFTAAETAHIDSMPGLRAGAVRQVGGGDARLAAAYRQAHAFVYPSLYEGFGIPPLEAMSCGCPVLCSSTSSLPEVVGDAGCYFDPTSDESIREALERLCYDRDLRQAMIAAGFAQRQRFSWDRCAGETLNAYRQVLTA
jgi:glycosyltransferase involved in cell wall biosynthesis